MKIAFGFLLVMLIGCHKSESVEQTGKAVDDGTDKAGDSVEDAAEVGQH